MNMIKSQIGVGFQDEAFCSAQSSSISDIENMSFNTIVSVRPSCAYINNTLSLTFNMTGIDALVYLANVVVERL